MSRLFAAWDVHFGGELIVADWQHHRVVAVDLLTGVTLCRFGGKGTKDGEFDCPVGIAAMHGKLYVSEFTNHRIQVFT